MKITILTGKFGMGHLSAALAIKQQIESSDYDARVEIIDWFHYVSPSLSEKYYKFFKLFVSQGHSIYNTRYRLQENRRTDQKPDLYYFFLWHFTKFIDLNKPDLIVSTLPICSQMVSWYKKKTGSAIPLITCVTDITGHSEWISKNTDFYMVGSQSVKEKIVSKGISEDKIFVTGIPVRTEFMREDIKKWQCRHERRMHLLVMGGGLGMLPEANDFYLGLEKLSGINVTIITGNNKKLYQQISGKYKNIHVVGYVNNVHEYMEQADAVITKPGGVTMFEAIHAGVPIIALEPNLQQEIYNKNFIREKRIGTVINPREPGCINEIINILKHGQLDFYRYNILRLRNNLKQSNIHEILERARNQRKQINYPYLVNVYNIFEKIIK